MRELPVGQRPDIFWASAPDAFEVLAGQDLVENSADLANKAAPAKVDAYPINDPKGRYLGQALAGAQDQEEAMTTADRMAVLDQGAVQQVGAPVTLYAEPANIFVAGFVGTTNLLPTRVRARQGGALTLDVAGLGEVQLPAGVRAPACDTLTLGFRPHALAIESAATTTAVQGIALPGPVESSEFLGEFTRYSVRVGTHALAVDHAHQAGGAAFAAGSAVRLRLEASQVRLFAG